MATSRISRRAAWRCGIDCTRIPNADQKAFDRLAKLKGTEFDKSCVDDMVEDHEKDVAAFEREIAKGSHPDVKAFAERTLPKLKHHLEMAKAMKGEV